MICLSNNTDVRANHVTAVVLRNLRAHPSVGHGQVLAEAAKIRRSARQAPHAQDESGPHIDIGNVHLLPGSRQPKTHPHHGRPLPLAPRHKGPTQPLRTRYLLRERLHAHPDRQHRQSRQLHPRPQAAPGLQYIHQ